MTTRKAGSLLSLEAMGGIVAGKGFDFQTRYAACHLPIWLLEDSFEQLLFEGTGDLDIRYGGSGKSSRSHIQVKDHEVSPAELKKVINHFKDLDQAMPGIYTRFTLACPTLSPTLRPIESALARFRGAKPFYDDVPEALAPTLNDINELLRKRDFSELIDFIHEKVYIDIGHGDLCHDDRAVELFVARLLHHPEFADRLRSMVQPAFSQLMNTITSSKGSVLSRGAIEMVLRSSVLSALENKDGVVVWIQNWTKETFNPPSDYSLDWTGFFERSSRKVPPPEVWNNELLPQLRDLQQRIVAEHTERRITFRGKCALSTGLCLASTTLSDQRQP